MAEPIDVSRKLSIADLIDGGFELTRREWLLLLLFIGVPSLLMNLWQPAEIPASAEGMEGLRQAGALLLTTLLVIAAYMVTYGAALNVLQSAVRGERADGARALAAGIARFPAVIGTSLLVAVVLLAAFLALIVPFVIVLVYMAFVFDATLLRNRWGAGAMRYSHALVKGQWWRTLGVFVVIMLPWVLLAMLGTMFDGGPIHVAILVGEALLTTFTSSALALYFFNRDALVNPAPASVPAAVEVQGAGGVGAMPPFEAPRP
jgi:hypothetical protein